MNLANKITLSRVFLVPVFLLFMLVEMPYGNYIAAAIFIIASLTDTLDGYIARSRNLVTDFGKFMDPLADKLIVTAALVALVEKGMVSSALVMIIIAREFAITGFRTLAAAQGIIMAAGPWGKLKTVIQIVAIVAALLNIPYYNIFMWIAVIITIISGVDYIYKNRKVISTK
jgi:CDP-diacylglycerol--glycerol-3-phosphate 3-phosphatidyltransferase